MAESTTPSQFTRRVRAAVRAAWLTLLAGAAIVTVQYVFYLLIVHVPPLARVVTLAWAADIATVRSILIHFMAIEKLFLLIWALGAIFLTLWSRALRSAD